MEILEKSQVQEQGNKDVVSEDKIIALRAMCGLCVSDRNANAFLMKDKAGLILWHVASKNLDKSQYWFGICLNNVEKYIGSIYPGIDVYIAFLFRIKKTVSPHEVLIIPLNKFVEWNFKPDAVDNKWNVWIREEEDLSGEYRYIINENGQDVTEYKIDNFRTATIVNEDGAQKMKTDLSIATYISELENEIVPIASSCIEFNKKIIDSDAIIVTMENVITSIKDQMDRLKNELDSKKPLLEDEKRKNNIYKQDLDKSEKDMAMIMEKKLNVIKSYIKEQANKKDEGVNEPDIKDLICGK